MDKASSNYDEDESLSGGAPHRVYRRGDLIARKVGPWTPAVQSLLRHFENLGITEVPRTFGISPDGFELVSFIEGNVTLWPHERDSVIRSEGLLCAVAATLRRLHDASESFCAPKDAAWQYLPEGPRTGPIICHNDHGPWNTIVRGGRVVGVIDWDMATPGTREWDLACAAWHWVPLYTDEEILSSGWRTLPDRSARLRLFSRAYGLRDVRSLFPVIRQRQISTLKYVEWSHSHPNEPGADVWLRVPIEAVQRDVDWLARNNLSLLRG